MALAIAVLALAGVARAEGNGIKFGNGRVHPYFQLESRFDSAAVMVRESEGGPFQVKGDLLLHFRPGLKLEVPSPMFAVGLKGALDYVLYTGAVHAGTRAGSHLQGDADLGLDINRDGQIGVEVGDHIVRSDKPMMPGLSVGALSLFNDARIRVLIRPEGGALNIEPSYHLTTEFFSLVSDGGVIPQGCTSGDGTCDPNAVSKLDYLNHTFGLTGRWKFMPKTAVVVDSGFGMRSYLSDDNGGTGINSLRPTIGLSGLFSTHFSTVLKFGWTHDFTSGSFSSPIGQAEVSYILSQTGQVKVGYLRMFEPHGGTFVSYGDDRLYADAKFLFAGQLTARGYFGADFVDYRRANGDSDRSDAKVTLDLGADWEAKGWLQVGAGYYLTYQSKGILGIDGFVRNEFYLRTQVIY